MKLNEETLSIKELDTEDNCNELFELSNEFFYEYENNNKDIFEIDSIKEEDIRNYFQRFIGHESNKAYIVIYDKKIIGYITLTINNQPDFWKVKKVGGISGLMVSKEFRKNGIGTKLVKKGMEYFGQKGIKYFTVLTSVNNINGISLYKKCGFEQLQTILYGRNK